MSTNNNGVVDKTEELTRRLNSINELIRRIVQEGRYGTLSIKFQEGFPEQTLFTASGKSGQEIDKL